LFLFETQNYFADVMVLLQSCEQKVMKLLMERIHY